MCLGESAAPHEAAVASRTRRNLCRGSEEVVQPSLVHLEADQHSPDYHGQALTTPTRPRTQIVIGLVASFVQSLGAPFLPLARVGSPHPRAPFPDLEAHLAGLTVQRLSHISNEKQPVDKRRRDWQRPLWLGGFAVFILSNVFGLSLVLSLHSTREHVLTLDARAGTLFQLGALPIVVLGPLGAVSLLWNAFFARIILGDSFTVQLAVGSILIAGGATLVGIFGGPSLRPLRLARASR